MLRVLIFSVFVVCFPIHFCNADQSFALCEGHNGFIRCSRGTLIRIITANYGRTDTTVCPVGQHNSQNCHSASSTLSRVRIRCNGNQKCHLSAVDSVFGNPCSGITKYLEVTFRCQKPSPINHFTIAFYAIMASTVSNARSGTVLVFSKVITNKGNAYNRRTGKFVAPRDGTYRFDWGYLVHHRRQAYVCGTLNNNVIQITSVGDSITDSHNMASGFMILSLKTGDEVYLQICYRNGYIFRKYSFFGGHMI